MKPKLILVLSIIMVCFLKGEKPRMDIYYKNLPVLITGGCGFIGSHIAEKLVELGAQVTIIDDLSTGSLKNIETIQNQVTFINKSIVNYEACLQATQGKKIIFHLAAFISVAQSMSEPKKCHEINVDGTLNILEAARINGVDHLVFSSSAAVYGPTNNICSEQSATDPQSPYALSKLIGELYCKQYAINFGLNTVICRYFNVWGPRQNPNGAYAAVVAKFMHQMEHNLPITIFGDGLQTRDFVPVAQVVQANLMLGMLAPTLGGQVFNIATGKSINLFELIDQLKLQYPNYTAGLKFEPARPGDLKYSSAQCQKYFNVLAQINA